jgi:WD40 repeat protein
MANVAFSHDSHRLAAVCRDESINVWDIATGKLIKVIRDMGNLETHLAFSPDGRHIVGGFKDKAAAIWSVETNKSPLVLEGHGATVKAVAYSPDGALIATGSDDKTVRLWDAATGSPKGVLQGAANGIVDVQFTPDGKFIVAVHYDSTTFWAVATQQPIISLRSISDIDSGYVWTRDGFIDFVGPDADKAKAFVQCKIGGDIYPFELCEEGLVVPGLLHKVLAGEEVEP